MQNIFIFLIGSLLGMVITRLFEFILKTNKNLRNKYYKHHEIFWGYHIHHSTYGILFIVISIILFFINQEISALFWAAFGIGVIIVHTISDRRFIFIEKQRL